MPRALVTLVPGILRGWTIEFGFFGFKLSLCYNFHLLKQNVNVWLPGLKLSPCNVQTLAWLALKFCFKKQIVWSVDVLGVC